MIWSLQAKLIIAFFILSAIGGGLTWEHHRIFEQGFTAGQAKLQKAVDDAREESSRKNASIVQKDQALVVAKAEDKEKIITIYKTIREQSDAQIIEVPVYRECHMPAVSVRLIAEAAAGGVRTDPKDAADHPAGGAAGS